MEEEQDVAGRDRRTGVHLHGPAPGRPDHPIRARPRELDGRIATAAVDDNHLVSVRAQRRERVEGRGDTGGLVEDRNDDRQAHAADYRTCAEPVAAPGAARFSAAAACR